MQIILSLHRCSDAGPLLRRAVHDALDGVAGVRSVPAPSQSNALPGLDIGGQRRRILAQEGKGNAITWTLLKLKSSWIHSVWLMWDRL